jgi:hypothetical protein
MESITHASRSATTVLAWLIAVIVLACTAWALAQLGGDPGAIGHPGAMAVATPATGHDNPGGLPWG